MIYYDELNASYAAATAEEKAEMVSRCLKWFVETEDTIQRNQLSLFFCDNNIVEAVPDIIRIATDPKYSDISDTLMYSLTEYKDISMTFDDLMKFAPIVANGSFLASRHSYLVIEKYIQNITSAENDRICNDLKQNIQNKCLNADLAQDLLEYLSIMSFRCKSSTNISNLTETYIKASSLEKEEIVRHLLNRFSSTKDMLERNKIAFFFTDNDIEEGILLVKKASLDPALRNECGSLIYALSENHNVRLSLSNIFGYLELVAEGTWEASHESFLFIERYFGSLENSAILRLYNKANEYVVNNCKNKNLVLDLIDVLDEYKK